MTKIIAEDKFPQTHIVFKETESCVPSEAGLALGKKLKCCVASENQKAVGDWKR